MPDIVNASQLLVEQAKQHQAAALNSYQIGNASDSCVKCLPEIIPCNVKLFIIIVWAVLIYASAYFTYQKPIVLMVTKKGKQITLGYVLDKFVVAWPFICLIIIGFLTLNVKPL